MTTVIKMNGKVYFSRKNDTCIYYLPNGCMYAVIEAGKVIYKAFWIKSVNLEEWAKAWR